MKLCKFRHPSLSEVSVGLIEDDERIIPLPGSTLTNLLEADDIPAAIGAAARGEPLALSDVTLEAPIDQQEVWAAGVTYKRSQTARMEESESRGVLLRPGVRGRSPGNCSSRRRRSESLVRGSQFGFVPMPHGMSPNRRSLWCSRPACESLVLLSATI